MNGLVQWGWSESLYYRHAQRLTTLPICSSDKAKSIFSKDKIGMANEQQIIQQIRFAIEQLSARSGHHEFESLCRHIARRTICTNILPATGPVSAGGDQGRDFETFRTYLRDTDLRDSTFIGMASEGAVTFACTIQRKNLAQKIKSDVKTILGSGITPDSIYMFLSQGMPVARRHELQTWASDTHQMKLEILDGEAIAEILCDPELFWIAEQYLAVPTEFRPKRNPEAIKDWYRNALDRWRESTSCTLNPANFHELASAARHATFSSEARSDVPLWINRLEQFHSEEAPHFLAVRATYEIAVASLRGLGTLHGREDELREYFEGIESLDTPAALKDATVLLSYCYGAFIRDAVQLSLVEILDFQQTLFNRLDERLDKAETATTRCALLNTKGYAHFFSFAAPDTHQVLDVEESVACWKEMLGLVSGAPLFPLDRFADHLTEIINLVGEFPGYSELSRLTDELLSDRCGDFVAADKCRDRALVFYGQKRVLRAIQELHQAKIGWFADETLQGSILAMLFLGVCYRELGLAFAAKQYAMAAAFIAVDSNQTKLKRHVPQALLSVAECDYMQGNWLDFVSRVSITLWSHHLVPNHDASEEAEDDEIYRVLFGTGIVLMVSTRLAPEINKMLEAEVCKWDMEDYFKKVRPMVTTAWADKSDDELWNSLESKLQGRPFGDVGTTRETIWKQLGVRWEVTYTNERETIARAEEFMASAQIFMAEWAGLDLCFLRTTVRVTIELDELASESSLEPQSTNDGRLWILKVPKKFEGEDHANAQQMALSHAVAILSDVSLLPHAEFLNRVEERFRDGVMGRVFSARSYHELYLNLSPMPKIESERQGIDVPETERNFNPSEHEDMGWFDGPAPGYTKEFAEEGIRNRYERGIRAGRLTIARLCKDDEFRDVVRRLRDEGWLDWHLILAITNIILNYRIGQPGFRKGKSAEEIHQESMISLNREESYDDIWIPGSKFSEEAMRLALQISSISTLKNEGLECRQLTPDLPAIDDFLRHRMGYWSDDVEHERVFDPE
ncbi:hypothetical protein COB72_00385 [bacterium]|nr:MAG: hypothetical protein COB72_00385 [bacterium]